MWNLLRVLGALRTGRLVRAVERCARALEAQVELQALAYGVPNPLAKEIAQAIERARREPPAEVSSAVDVDPKDYVVAEARRQEYEATRGRRAAFDQDFMGAPAEDAIGDEAIASGRAPGATVYPEDFSVPPGDQLRQALAGAPGEDPA